MRENVIEWLNGDDKVTVSLSQIKYINKVKKLKDKYPDDVEIVAENEDGSLTAKLPLSAIKISIIKVSDENRAKARERFLEMRGIHND